MGDVPWTTGDIQHVVLLADVQEGVQLRGGSLPPLALAALTRSRIIPRSNSATAMSTPSWSLPAGLSSLMSMPCCWRSEAP